MKFRYLIYLWAGYWFTINFIAHNAFHINIGEEIATIVLSFVSLTILIGIPLIEIIGKLWEDD